MEKLKNYKTDKLLTNALMELMSEKDFSQIKVNEICEKALVHKTTFYNHYEDKYDLLNNIIQNIHKGIREKATKGNGLISYYLSIAKLYIEEIKRNPKIYELIIKYNSDEMISYMLIENIFNDLKVDVKGEYNNIPSNYIARFYISAVFATINEWFQKGMKEDTDTIVKYIEILIKSKKD